jgi:hypothetical protein
VISRNKSRRFRLPLALLATGVLTLALPGDDAEAGNRGRFPVIRQLTTNTTGTIVEPNVRLERAETVTFVSDGDVLGPGSAPGHREIYLYHRPSDTIRRLTTTTNGESYQAIRETDETRSRRPKYVVFVSTGNLDTRVGNADGNPEIFIHLTDTGEVRQLTDTPAGIINADPYSSDHGQCIVWRSTGDLDNNDGSESQTPSPGFDNADGSDEIFMLRFVDETLDGALITQVSNGPAGTVSSNPVIGGYWFTRQCRSTSYQSDHDQLGNGSTGSHIYNYTKLSAETEQLSNIGGFGISVNPAITGASSFARGPFVVFESEADILDNGSSGFELFRHRLFSTEQKQYTYQAAGETRNPAISDGGGFITFESTSDLLDPAKRVKSGGAPPFNADGNSEIYLSKGRKRIWQLTRTSGCENLQPSIQENGDAIAFISNCDLVPGRNPIGAPQLFLYFEVTGSDPWLSADKCKVAEGCCNVANGCYTPILGRQVRPPSSPRN